MGFFRNYVNRKIDELKLDVQDKGYFANLVVDHLKGAAMDKNNIGYGQQINAVTRDINVDSRFVKVISTPQLPSTVEATNDSQKTIQLTGTKITKQVKEKPQIPDIFQKIVGHEPLKTLLKSTMNKIENEGVLLHTLLVGAPGGAKSIFLECIRDAMPRKSYFAVGSHATKAAINQKLYSSAGQLTYLLIDELDKMKSDDRQGLLDMMSSGRINETKMGDRTRSAAVNVSVIAAANDISDFSRELKSRFFIVQVKDYSLAEFKMIARQTFKHKFSEEIADYLATQVWDVAGSRDFRDVLKIGDRVNSKEDIDTYITFMI